MVEKLNEKESIQAANDLLTHLNAMGWNLYPRTETSEPNQVIREGPATELQLESGYVLMPKVEPSNSPGHIFRALWNLADRLGGNQPTIVIDDQRRIMLGLTPLVDNVHIHGPEGVMVKYDDLIEALSTYPNLEEM